MPELALTRSLTAALCGPLALLVLPAAALAADGEATPLHLSGSAPKAAADTAASGGGAGAIVRTIVGLAVVIGVIYGIAWVLKQVKGSRETRATGAANLFPVATLPLGGQRALHLVRAGEELVLLGVGEHGVTPVRTYTEAEARALGLLAGGDGDDQDPDVPGGLLTAPARRRSWLDELRSRTVIR